VPLGISGSGRTHRVDGGAIVVDASVAAAWCFEDEVSPFTETVLDAVVRDGARVPALWVVEMSNVLAMAERHGRLDAARVDQILAALVALPVTLEHGDVSSLAPALVRLARAHRLTAHDAAYLELAMRTGLPLATRDASLLTAAGRVGVSLFDS
jgi:predicted nucleic acid-binding protein